MSLLEVTWGKVVLFSKPFPGTQKVGEISLTLLPSRSTGLMECLKLPKGIIEYIIQFFIVYSVTIYMTIYKSTYLTTFLYVTFHMPIYMYLLKKYTLFSF